MSIISISRLSYTSGEAIAHNVSSRLEYNCIDLEVFRDASERSGIPQVKLEKALKETPSLLFGMSLATRKRYVMHIQAALSAHFLEDNVVYHGPFGTHLIEGVSHFLKVRIYAQLEDRITLKVKRDGCSYDEAKRVILRDDRQRLELADILFKADDDNNDPFDLLINTSRMDINTAVEVIAETVKQSRYKPMTYSVRCMEAQELSHRVKSSLVDLDPDIDVQVDSGNVRVRIKAQGWTKKKRISIVRERVSKIEGVKSVEIEAVADIFDRIVGSSRLR